MLGDVFIYMITQVKIIEHVIVLNYTCLSNLYSINSKNLYILQKEINISFFVCYLIVVC